MTSQSLFLLAPISGIPRRRFPKRYPSGEVSKRIPKVLLVMFSVTTVSHMISSCYPPWQLDRTPQLLLLSVPMPISWLIHPYSPKNPSNYCWFLPRDVSYIRASSLLWLLLDFHVFLKQWNPIVLSPQVCLPFPSYWITSPAVGSFRSTYPLLWLRIVEMSSAGHMKSSQV